MLNSLNNPQTETSSSSSNLPSSLLLPITAEENVDDVVGMCHKLVDTLSALRSLRVRRADLINRQQLNPMNLLESIQISSSTSAETSSPESSDPTVHDVLVDLGKAKQAQHDRTLLGQLNDEEYALQIQLTQLTSMISKSTLLSGPTLSCKVDCSLTYLLKREYGLTTGSSHNYNPSLALHNHRNMRKQRFQTLYNYSLLWSSSGHGRYPAYTVVVDKTSRYAITGADDYLVKVWDLQLGELKYTCRGHQAEISIVALSPDNANFASTCTAGVIRIWRLSDGLCLHVLKHRTNVGWMKFDQDRGALVSGDDEGQCIIWDLSRIIPSHVAALPLIDKLLLRQAPHVTNENPAPPISAPSSSIVDVETSSTTLVSSDDIEFIGSTANNHPIDTTPAYSSSSSNQPVLSTPSHASSSSSSSSLLAADLQRGGYLYEWSSPLAPEIITSPGAAPHSTAPGTCKLILPHISDTANSQTGEGEEIKILCLDICPVGNIIVTGGSDGIARVWRIASDDDCISGSIYRTRNRGSNEFDRELLRSLEASVSSRELSRLKLVGKYMLMRLEGHIRAINDVHFSNFGDRVLTNASAEGTVRVWSFNKDFAKADHIIINANDDQSEPRQAAPAPSFNPMRRNRKVAGNSLTVHSACWTCDDQRIVTLQSVKPPVAAMVIDSREIPTGLKVWCSMTGDLLRVLPVVSDVESVVLDCHPTQPGIALVGSRLGTLGVWDIENECVMCLHRFPVGLTDDKWLNIGDAVFSPDGALIVCTDGLGRISVLGASKPDRFALVKREQYFSTDYAPITNDDEGLTIDNATQLPIHLAPRGPLVQLNGTPYDDVGPKSSRGPEPDSLFDIDAMISDMRARKKALPRIMERTYATFTRNKAKGRHPRTACYSAESAQSAMPASSSTTFPRTSGLTRQERSTTQTRRLDGTSVPASSSNYRTFDPAQYVPSSDESDGDSEWDNIEQDEPDEAWAGRGGVPRSERVLSRLLRQTSQAPSRSSSSMRRSGRLLSQDHTQPSRHRSKRRRVATSDSDSEGHEVISLSDNDTADDDGSVGFYYDDDNLGDYDHDDALATFRAKRKATRASSSTTHTVKSKGSSKHQKATYSSAAGERVPKHVIGRWAGKAGQRIVPLDTHIEREWLQNTRQVDYLYCPQVGDRVYYFPQGHYDMLHEFPESSSPPWHSFGQHWCAVDCLVRDISFDFPTEAEHRRCPSVLVHLTLVLMRTPQSRTHKQNAPFYIEFVEPRATRHSVVVEHVFTITLRRYSLPEFVVLKPTVDRALRVYWQPGTRVRIKYLLEETQECEEYGGTVMRLSDVSPGMWPHSPWNALEVLYRPVEGDPESQPVLFSPTSSSSSSSDAIETPTDIYERISPWECVFDDDTHRSLDTAFAARVSQDIQALMAAEEQFQPFMYAVDSVLLPDYYSVIPVPMYVDLICSRLNERYYRQVMPLTYILSFFPLTNVPISIAHIRRWRRWSMM